MPPKRTRPISKKKNVRKLSAKSFNEKILDALEEEQKKNELMLSSFTINKYGTDR
jgi:hypothetical protein